MRLDSEIVKELNFLISKLRVPAFWDNPVRTIGDPISLAGFKISVKTSFI